MAASANTQGATGKKCECFFSPASVEFVIRIEGKNIHNNLISNYISVQNCNE